MHSNDTGNNSSRPRKKQPWYRSQSLVLFLCVISVFNWIGFMFFDTAQMSIKPTMLILKPEGCDFFRQNSIPVQSNEHGVSCSVTAPYRPSLMGSGGIVFIGDREIMLADNQVVVVAALDNQPWTPRQQRLMIWSCISIVIMLGLVAWLFNLLHKQDE
jgi:hypothetical protein